MGQKLQLGIHLQAADGTVQHQTVELQFPLTTGEELVKGPLTYNSDGLATVHSANFLREPLFAEAYRLGISTGHQFGDHLHIEWRVHVCCWAASHARHLPGDFVECGVNTGILSRAVVHYVDFASQRDRVFYLLDTFCGIPVEQLTEGERLLPHADFSASHYEDCYALAKRNFAGFPNVKLIRGKVPDTLREVPSEQVAYLSIDMNSVVPEIAAAEYFWDKLVPGAVVVLDDYGFPECIHQKVAFDRFARQRGVRILSLPTGQGLILKP